MILRKTSSGTSIKVLFYLALLCTFLVTVKASRGDQLPEFKECIQVCIRENCDSTHPLSIPLHRKLLLWTCPSECDHTCQTLTTQALVASQHSIEQYHGKWPFTRLFGIQEPASVLFSLFNYAAHSHGLALIRSQIPSTYPLRPYYALISYFGMAAWIASCIFHTRDFPFTEQVDYFAAGATVLYGLYYTPIRIFRLYDSKSPNKQMILKAWTTTCVLAYIAHVTYLKCYRWNYTYNMTANIVVGILQYIMWISFSINEYRNTGLVWRLWPVAVVLWVLCAMSLEVFDFPPIWGILDAHALWHAGTVGPVVVFYNFLLRDAKFDIAAGERLKQ